MAEREEWDENPLERDAHDVLLSLPRVDLDGADGRGVSDDDMDVQRMLLSWQNAGFFGDD